MVTEWTPALRLLLEELAIKAGFDLAGVASAVSGTEETAERFVDWVSAGRAGEMEYLKRRDEQGVLLRSDVRVAIPWARSVIVCALNYNANGPRSIDPAPVGAGWIARYAWSGKQVEGELRPSDYHDDLLVRLRQIEEGLRAEADCQTRCYVDTGPILERDFAAKAGVGWIGKNTCVLNQEFGSWLLLGVIVTSLPVSDEAAWTLAAPDRCGSCTRCIDVCPTDALVAPRQMDASLCIAYLTIEKKGGIAGELRGKMGRQVFGCDICQDVCPWNRKAPVAHTAGLRTRRELVNPGLSWLAAMDSRSLRSGSKDRRSNERSSRGCTATWPLRWGTAVTRSSCRSWSPGARARTRCWPRRRGGRWRRLSGAMAPDRREGSASIGYGQERPCLC